MIFAIRIDGEMRIYAVHSVYAAVNWLMYAHNSGSFIDYWRIFPDGLSITEIQEQCTKTKTAGKTAERENV